MMTLTIIKRLAENDLKEYHLVRAEKREKNHRGDTTQHQSALPGGETRLRLIRDQQV